MTEPLKIRIYESQRLVYESDELTAPVELGRQLEGEEGPYALRRQNGGWRLVVAQIHEDTVSRKHLRAEALPDGRWRLTNLRPKLHIDLGNGDRVEPLGVRELALPYVLSLGRKTVRFQGREEVTPGAELQSLADVTRPPSLRPEPPSRLASLALPPAAAVEKEAVVQWLRAAMTVLQSAAHSSEFLEQAAHAAVEMVNLDSCRVLLLKDGEWQPQGAASRAPSAGSRPRLAEPSWHPSREVLRRVLQEKKTFWQKPAGVISEATSLVGVKAIVAAPILDPRGEVIGALYGDRRQDGTAPGVPQVSRLDAMLVELLASGVAAGLARQEQEKAAASARVQFEQFFTPELSRELASRPDLLEGQDAEVTILFADIRGFSRISEKVGPAETVKWIRDVMGALSDCVHDHGGVLVDYIGDELMAMWGAPERAPDHARRAVQAALAMLARLPRLNDDWQPRLGEPISIGIGINTGVAHVGNTGSHRKFKYGPLGNTVNLASRVQGASKYLRARLLVTGPTHERLGADFDRRRLGKVRVVNIAQPVELYEVVPPGQPNWAPLKQRYEEALAEFERGEFRSAARIVGNLCVEYPGDGPSLLLLSRTVTVMIEEARAFDPVWDLPGK